jgi:hypothetical protein
LSCGCGATAGADEELEGWDAALSNFDTAQDAAPAAPTKEQQEAAAARAMVSQHLYCQAQSQKQISQVSG